jgi:hypothetical protein
MKRVLGHCLAGLTLLCGGIALTSACAHNDSSLFVENALYPTPVAQGQSCTFTADPNQTVISVGKLDLAFGNDEYGAVFLIGNQLVAQASSQNLKTETSIINIEGAIIVDTDAAGNQLDTFTSPASGTVLPSTGSVPGYSSIGAVVTSPKAISALRSTEGKNLDSGGSTLIITYVKFFGHTLGGTYIESNNFEYPITICETSVNNTACLINFSQSEAAECNGVAVKTPNCLAPSATAVSLPVPCQPGQDTVIDCSQCQSVKACEGEYTGASPCAVDAGAD